MGDEGKEKKCRSCRGYEKNLISEQEMRFFVKGER
jgi:hypothetical protein